MNKRPAVFLDRDGTLIEEAEYLSKVEDLRVFEQTFEAVKTLNSHNIPAIVVTNQSGVARGYFDEKNVHTINSELSRILEVKGAHIDAYYYCPHHTKGTMEEYTIECDCRKPLAGMIRQAVKDFDNLDVQSSYVIGDKVVDLDLAKNAGCKGILVKTGYGRKLYEENGEALGASFVAETIKEAVDWILKDLNL